MAPDQVQPDELRAAMAGFPTGVAVVTALEDGAPAGATVNAFTSLSLWPPLVLAALDRGSRTLAAIERAGRFGVNGLAAGQEEIARGFASKEPVAEKWQGVEWSGSGGAARIAGSGLWIACELADVAPGGDHVVLTGAVSAIEATDAVPLVFVGGEYRPL